MDNVVSLDTRRKVKSFNQNAYKAFIDSLGKLELMEEMVNFQTMRSDIGHLSLDMILRGRILFPALYEAAETPELRILTGSYMRHLEYEYAAYISPNGPDCA